MILFFPCNERFERGTKKSKSIHVLNDAFKYGNKKTLGRRCFVYGLSIIFEWCYKYYHCVLFLFIKHFLILKYFVTWYFIYIRISVCFRFSIFLRGVFFVFDIHPIWREITRTIYMYSNDFEDRVIYKGRLIQDMRRLLS